ncbi:F-box protein At3g07870-like [Andrographis paniculata]|uniref:F-box protein At3g07870-like n=1 Tax=Andrographis paniculata TaxID=175694 RepID=UPI0021E77EE8|nr:F-box protein At3g07870-like [Andrographis paniculata]
MRSVSKNKASLSSRIRGCGLWLIRRRKRNPLWLIGRRKRNPCRFFHPNSKLAEDRKDFDKRYLPHEMMIEILTWLPPEELLRCRSVCKSWLSAISDANFIADHRQKNSSKDRVVILTTLPAASFGRLVELEYRLFSDGNCSNTITQSFRNDGQHLYASEKWDLEGTCNGVFCLTNYLYDSYLYDIDYKFMICLCDSSIRRLSLIPNYKSRYRRSTDRFGIGFDTLEKGYKIVKVNIFFFRGRHFGQAAVLSLKSMIWKDIECLLYGKTLRGKSIFLHGSIHWIGDRVDATASCVVSFDLRNEVFKELELPRCKYTKKMSIHVVGGDTLCAMAFEDEDLTCRVWMMKEYGVAESWIEQYKAVLPVGILRCVDVSIGGRLLCVSDGSDLYLVKSGLLEKLIDKRPDSRRMKARDNYGKYILYDLQSQNYTSICWGDLDCIVFSIQSSLDFL